MYNNVKYFQYIEQNLYATKDSYELVKQRQVM